MGELERYSKKCPFCGFVLNAALYNNLICGCGAKYYFFEKFWLNRLTGKVIRDSEVSNGQD